MQNELKPAAGTSSPEHLLQLLTRTELQAWTHTRSVLERSSSNVVFCTLTKLCQENAHIHMKNVFFTYIKLYIATKRTIWYWQVGKCNQFYQQPLNQANESTDTQSAHIHLAVSCTVPKPGFSYFLKDMLSAEVKITFGVLEVRVFAGIFFFLIENDITQQQGLHSGPVKMQHKVFQKQCPCCFDFHNTESRSSRVKLYADGSKCPNCILFLGLGCWQRGVTQHGQEICRKGEVKYKGVNREIR